jgi:TolA-binding protein
MQLDLPINTYPLLSSEARSSYSISFPKQVPFLFLLVLLCALGKNVFAEKVLMYDEEKGIIFVDKATGKILSQTVPSAKQTAPATGNPLETEEQPAPVSRPQKKGLRVVAPGQDIHQGRKKDPASIYYQSAIEYFRNKDYQSALKNFLYADSKDPNPIYTLWIGKTYRQLGKYDQMLLSMQSILHIYPESDVADDALFEIAFLYQVTDNYDSAIIMYSQLAERYPFGTSFSNGEEFLAMAREQRKTMRSEMISNLNLLGYRGDDLDVLYSTFQKARGLPVTGKGDQETIKLIKADYTAFLNRDAALEAQRAVMSKLFSWMVGIGAVLLINCIILLLFIFSARRKAKQVQSLQKVIKQLDTQSL